MPAPRLIVIADPEGRRWQQLQQEANEAASPFELSVVSWADILDCEGQLDGLAEFDEPALVRVDSTGENFDLTRKLISIGARRGGKRSSPEKDWSALEYRKGWLAHPRLAWLGWKHVLLNLEQSFEARSQLQPLARPSHIAAMFDKLETSARIREAGLPCPDEVDTSLCFTGSDVLVAIEDERIETAFAKLHTGSAATGIIAINTRDQARTGLTSMIEIAGDIFNTLRLQTVESDTLERLLGFLLDEGLCVQRGIPKARIDGQGFDLRVIVVDGEPEFTIFRLSNAPMTNLHFGGRRGDFEQCRQRIPTRVWLDALDSCVEAAAQFDSHMVGVDLVFERGYFAHYILEVNAFGDFFPGWRDSQSRTIYQAELESLQRKYDS